MKYIMVDLDGTCCEFQHKDSVLLPNWFENGIFEGRRPVKEIIVKLQKLQENYFLFILSVAPSHQAIKEKEMWVDTHMPFIEHRYYVGDPKRKVAYLNEITKQNKMKRDKCYVLDDTHAILQEAEIDGYKPLHTSSFLAMEDL
jgi:hypothetical protein